ncbi:hypothetical protein [Marinobacterium aestuariivivens]|uniref:Uncharacterized protein n=1 Tax=Marinobacterium aestuariivivens TaxID=1698799 RepID=A0ABW2A992_9GAMM
MPSPSFEAQTPSLPSPLKVKNFGNDRSFGSVAALKTALSEDYKGMHVTIVYPTKPHGLTKTVFVSVSDTGEIRESYGDGALVDFDRISETHF